MLLVLSSRVLSLKLVDLSTRLSTLVFNSEISLCRLSTSTSFRGTFEASFRILFKCLLFCSSKYLRSSNKFSWIESCVSGVQILVIFSKFLEFLLIYLSNSPNVLGLN